VHVDDFLEELQRCLRLLAVRGEEACLEAELALQQLQNVAVEGRILSEEGEVAVEPMYRRIQKPKRCYKVCNRAASIKDLGHRDVAQVRRILRPLKHE